MLDAKIVGGVVHDGMGSDPVIADVGIAGDRICAIGDLRDAEAAETLDATDCLVCPGFIDAHSHSDTFILLEPTAPSKIYQGVTTEICGNCGASAAPLQGDYKLPSDWRDKTYARPWSSVAEYRERLAEAEPALNIGLLAGHGAIRGAVCGYEGRAASSRDLQQMRRLLDQALEEGALGMSTGLVYPPGMFADEAELAELGHVLSRHGGVFTSHMRSEGPRLLEAMDEVLAVGRTTGCGVQVSHLKAAGKANWHKLDEAFEKIASAQADGIDVAADRYPYTFSCTSLDIVFPEWAEEGGNDEIVRRVRDAAGRARIRAELLDSRPEDYWGTVVIGSTREARFKGKPLLEIAAVLGLHPVDTVLHLVDVDEAGTWAFFHGMSEENLFRVLAQPYVMLGSDASLRAPTGVLSEDFPHPRAYGSFTRFLRWALDGRTVPLPEAIRKMTALPAERFGLAGRGRIADGCFADICVVNPARVHENATCAAPHALSEGIRHLFVNGTLTIRNRRLSDRRGGVFLSRFM